MINLAINILRDTCSTIATGILLIIREEFLFFWCNDRRGWVLFIKVLFLRLQIQCLSRFLLFRIDHLNKKKMIDFIGSMVKTCIIITSNYSNLKLETARDYNHSSRWPFYMDRVTNHIYIVMIMAMYLSIKFNREPIYNSQYSFIRQMIYEKTKAKHFIPIMEF